MHLSWARIGENQTGHEAAWQLLEAMYRQQTGKALPQVVRTSLGKPYFVNDPWYFSLTHTKHHVFCVLSDRPVGIDGEEEDRTIRLELADKILSPAEQVQYELAENKIKALLTFWVLKEAAAKCSGRGLQPYPRDTEFSLDDPRVQIIDGCLVAVIEEDNHVI